jgi:type I restriction enzyme S subunit
MRRYEKYKQTHVQWIGAVPTHWQEKKLKYLCSQRDEKVDSSDFIIGVENIEGGTGKLVDLENEVIYSGQLSAFKREDTIFNKLRPYLHKVYFAENDGAVIGELLVLYPHHEMHSKYLYYILFSKSFINTVDSSTQGTKMPRANWNDFISQLTISYPPSLQEQTAIANCLDEKTAQIDTLIEKKQNLIELLKEERKAIINEAVSGEGKNWQRKKLKYIADVISGAAFDSSDFSKAGPARVLKISNIQHDYVDWTDSEYVSEHLAEVYKKFRVLNGDILFALTRPIILSGIKSARAFFDSKEIVLLNQRNAILRVNAEVDSSFMYYVTHSKYFFEMFQLSIDNTGQQPNISPVAIENFEVFLPARNEQIRIASELKGDLQRVDQTIDKISSEMGLINEYKTALISEVVTGKVKVV